MNSYKVVLLWILPAAGHRNDHLPKHARAPASFPGLRHKPHEEAKPCKGVPIFVLLGATLAWSIVVDLICKFLFQGESYSKRLHVSFREKFKPSLNMS